MKRNPFLTSGYISPEYFCNRVSETGRITDVIKNQRHLTLFSPRRMGKTGLIKHAFHEITGSKEKHCIYFDILATTNLREFVESFGKAVLSAMAGKESVMKRLLRQFSSLRLRFSIDPLTGEPSVSFTLANNREAEDSLNTVFTYMTSQKQGFTIAIDEFQQISVYPEKNIEALLRSQQQNNPDISFIFSGSRQHILGEIFSLPGRPLFNTSEMMEIGIIDPGTYKAFISEKFEKGSKTITPAALDTIEELTGMHTFYVQVLCNRLYGSVKNADKENVSELLAQILKENEPVYANYLNLLTPTQFRLLKAIAMNRGVSFPTSGEFLSEYRLGSPSTVQQALKSLTQKQFIYFDGTKHRLTDVFFSWWTVFK